VHETGKHDHQGWHVVVEDTGVACVKFVQTEQWHKHGEVQDDHGDSNGVVGRMKSKRHSADCALVHVDALVQCHGENYKDRQKHHCMAEDQCN